MKGKAGVEIPYDESLYLCISCIAKHANELLYHLKAGLKAKDLDPELRKALEEYAKAALAIRDWALGLLDIEDKKELYEALQNLEHVCRDFLMGLRELRHFIAEQCGAIGNPGPEHMVVIWEGRRKEVVEPLEHFDPRSLRILCPKCPEGRCSLCPADIYPCTTRIIVGCPKGHYDPKTGKCKVGTRVHVVYHSVCPVKKEGNPGNPGKEGNPAPEELKRLFRQIVEKRDIPEWADGVVLTLEEGWRLRLLKPSKFNGYYGKYDWRTFPLMKSEIEQLRPLLKQLWDVKAGYVPAKAGLVWPAIIEGRFALLKEKETKSYTYYSYEVYEVES